MRTLSPLGVAVVASLFFLVACLAVLAAVMQATNVPGQPWKAWVIAAIAPVMLGLMVVTLLVR